MTTRDHVTGYNGNFTETFDVDTINTLLGLQLIRFIDTKTFGDLTINYYKGYLAVMYGQ